MLDEQGRREKKGTKKTFIKYHEVEISDEWKIQVIDTKTSVIVDYCTQSQFMSQRLQK